MGFGQDMWLHGPKFLAQPEDEWPETIVTEPPSNEEALKVMKITVLQPRRAYVAVPVRVGSWTKMIRVTAYAQRFICAIQKRREDRKKCELKLSKAELEAAEVVLHREAQETFSEEIELVRSRRCHDMPRRS